VTATLRAKGALIVRLALSLLLLTAATPAATGQSAAPEAPKTAAADPASLLESALPYIRDLYLHPDAVVPRDMARAALQRMERTAPGVLVTEPGDGTVEVRLGERVRRFGVDDVADLAALERRVDEVVGFLREGLAPDAEPSVDALEIAALHGILATVDRHSRLITGDGVDDFNDRFQGTLVGIGARIGHVAGLLSVKAPPFAGSPALRGGLREGDGITHVDGVPTGGMTVNDAVDRIRGPEGVPVVLTVQRRGEHGRRAFVLVREKVIVPSIESELLAEGIGLVRIDHFSQRTADEFAEHVDGLREQGDLRGLVVDLRGNTGGSMKHAARIVNAFVESGTLVRTEGRGGAPVEKLTPRIDANAEFVRWEGPVAVLIDAETASGSEIVAGGLKFLDRSLTIGQQSFGKGTVQKVYTLRDGRDPVQLKLTVARYLLPDDGFINGVGVTPDLATAQLWMSGPGVELPDVLREPPDEEASDEGHGGVDARRNPGGGRDATVEGANAEPVLRLLYPRVLKDWDPAVQKAVHEAEQAMAEAGAPMLGRDGQRVEILDEPSPPSAAGPQEPGRSGAEGDCGDDRFNDMELRLAWEVLREAAPGERRDALVARAAARVDAWQDLQARRLEEAARLRGIAWSTEPPTRWMDRAPARSAELAGRLATPPPAVDARLVLPEVLQAGEDVGYELRVVNNIGRPLHHLRALLESSTASLDGVAWLVGDLDPGQGWSGTVQDSIPASVTSRLDTWRLYLMDDDGPLGGPFEGSVPTRGRSRPELRLQVTSESRGEPDGSLRLDLHVRLRQDGGPESGELRVSLAAPEGGVLERTEQFRTIPRLAGKEVAEVTLGLRASKPPPPGAVPLTLRVTDPRSAATLRVELAVPTAGRGLDTGWLEPPRLALVSPRSEPEAPPARGGAGFRLQGEARAAHGLRSVEVYVGNDKVYGRESRQAGPDGKPGSPSVRSAREWPLDLPVQLSRGPNRILVEARTSDGVQTRQEYWVLGEAAR
jgi:carboxyl-terminal processing protease